MIKLLLLGQILFLVILVRAVIFGYLQFCIRSVKVESERLKAKINPPFVEGIELSGRSVLQNDIKMPTYIPKTNHTFIINGQDIYRKLTTQGRWLSPGETFKIPFQLSIGKSELPGVVVSLLLARKTLDIVVRTRIGIGPFKTTFESESEVDHFFV